MRDIVENINNLSKEKREKLLKDPKFREEIFDSGNHYPFVWLVQGLKNEDLLCFLDSDIISFLSQDERTADKLNAIITCGNPFCNEFLKSEKVIELINENIGKLHYYLYLLDERFGQSYFNYLLDNNLNVVNLYFLSDKVQLSIVKNPDNLKRLTSGNLPSAFLSNLGKETIEYLLNDKFFEVMFLNYSAREIDYIIKKGVTLPINIQENKDIISKFALIKNISEYNDYFIDLGKNNNFLSEKVFTLRKKIYQEKVKSIDLELKIFEDYKGVLNGRSSGEKRLDHIVIMMDSDEDKLEILQERTTTVLLEMIVDINFQDITYNFLKNALIVVNYAKDKKGLIPEDRLIIYQKLINFYDLSIEEQIALFFELINKEDNMGVFYDDFRTCLDDSYQRLHDSCLDVNNLEKKGETQGISIYHLDGEKFKILINHTYINREDSNIVNAWSKNDKTASLSLIGDSHLGTFRDPSESVILGFNNFDVRNIMHMYKSDSFTSHEQSSDRVFSIYTPEELLANTLGYNEILIKENGDLKPSYVVCYDEIKSGDIATSHCLGNIPLVVINTKKYDTKKAPIDIEGDKYISHGQAYLIDSYKRGQK